MYRRFTEPDADYRQIYGNPVRRSRYQQNYSPFASGFESIKSLFPKGTDMGDVILLLILLLLYIDTGDEEFLITLLGTFIS